MLRSSMWMRIRHTTGNGNYNWVQKLEQQNSPYACSHFKVERRNSGLSSRPPTLKGPFGGFVGFLTEQNPGITVLAGRGFICLRKAHVCLSCLSFLLPQAPQSP